MVAEISNLSPRRIWFSMDYVEGLHYVAIWWEKRKIPLTRVGAAPKLSNMVL